MSILSGFKKQKIRQKLTDGNYQNVSCWTSSQTVEMDDGDTLENTALALKNTIQEKLSITGGTLSGNVLISHEDATASQIEVQNNLHRIRMVSSTSGNIGLYTDGNEDLDGNCVARWLVKCDKNGNVTLPGVAEVARTDTQGNNIASSYINNLSISGTTLTYTKGDGTSDTFTTQDTTYNVGTDIVSGLTKLYTQGGKNTDGTLTQLAITTALSSKAEMKTKYLVGQSTQNVAVGSTGMTIISAGGSATWLVIDGYLCNIYNSSSANFKATLSGNTVTITLPSTQIPVVYVNFA